MKGYELPIKAHAGEIMCDDAYLNPVYKSNWYLILLTTHISKLLTNYY